MCFCMPPHRETDSHVHLEKICGELEKVSELYQNFFHFMHRVVAQNLILLMLSLISEQRIPRNVNNEHIDV